MNHPNPLYRFGYRIGQPIGKGIALVLWHTLPKSTLINLAERKGWVTPHEATQLRKNKAEL
jgi:hypothetical protein